MFKSILKYYWNPILFFITSVCLYSKAYYYRIGYHYDFLNFDLNNIPSLISHILILPIVAVGLIGSGIWILCYLALAWAMGAYNLYLGASRVIKLHEREALHYIWSSLIVCAIYGINIFLIAWFKT